MSCLLPFVVSAASSPHRPLKCVEMCIPPFFCAFFSLSFLLLAFLSFTPNYAVNVSFCSLLPSLFLCFVLSDDEKSAIKKHEGKFVTMDPQAMYTIDRINNGLYR